jgi:type II secretory pathway pseudopilin PulG
MNYLRLCSVFAVCLGASAQLTKDQKVADFMQLSAVFAKNYTAYEWKRDVLKYDLLDIKPWLDRIAQSKDDLDFYAICADYVARLQDGDSQYIVLSDFTADLRFSVDIYDGKVLVDGIDRQALSSRTFPFQVGDELVSVDGKTADELVQAFTGLNTWSNPVARRRLGAQLITFREQDILPRAHEIGDTAKVVILRQSGAMESYDIPWVKTGTPLLGVGPVPSPKSVNQKASPRLATALSGDMATVNVGALNRDTTGFEGPKATPFPGFFPLFNPPDSFRLRLGASLSDAIVTGTYKSGDVTLGYVRLPTLALSAAGQRQFQTEIAFFQQNTDGLVIDIMGVASANFCTEQSLLTFLIPRPFAAMGYQVRATEFWLNRYAANLQGAIDARADQWIIDSFAASLKAVQQAYAEKGGKTGTLPFCAANLTWQPATDASGAVTAYTKPITVLTDEISIGDVFAAMLQDEGRAQIVGQRTSGLGGGGAQYFAGNFSEGVVVVNINTLIRNRLITTSDFPTTPFLENVGVRPDVTVEFQTKDNLLTGGKPFVDAITAAAVAWVKKNQ